MGENVAVIDHDDDFIKAGYANPERAPGIITPSLVRSRADASTVLRAIVGRVGTPGWQTVFGYWPCLVTGHTGCHTARCWCALSARARARLALGSTRARCRRRTRWRRKLPASIGVLTAK
jgi:hypothetical protein